MLLMLLLLLLLLLLLWLGWLLSAPVVAPRRLLLLLRVPLATAKVFKKVGKNLRLPRLSSLRFRARFAWCLAHADTFTLSRLKARGGAEGWCRRGGGRRRDQPKGTLQQTTMSSIATCDWTLVCLSGNPIAMQEGQLYSRRAGTGSRVAARGVAWEGGGGATTTWPQ